MPPVSWETFALLPGSADANFEFLCRALIRRHYGAYGAFAARAAQPGVEFHLRLHSPCSLGDPPRWYGWQCRWYDLDAGRPLGGVRRKKIVEALATTVRELPDLTDWVLWTRRPLTAADQIWFYGLSMSMRLHLWTAAEVEAHLTGEAEILRGTYFGDLILTPPLLADRHRESVAPIRIRWRPEVHRAVDAERQLRAILGGSDAWDELLASATPLRVASDAMHRTDVPDLFQNLVEEVGALSASAADSMRNVHAEIAAGDLDRLRQGLTRPRLRPTRHVAHVDRSRWRDGIDRGVGGRGSA